MLPRFVLVDPSFIGSDGDKWQYAIAFAKSAESNGYKYVLLTHQEAPAIARSLDFKIDQRNIFSHAFYQHSGIVNRHGNNASAQRWRVVDARTREELNPIERRIAAAQQNGQIGRELLARTVEHLYRVKATARAACARAADIVHETTPTPFNRDDFALALARELASMRLQPGDRVFFHTMTYGMMESLTEVTAAMDLEQPIDVDAYFLFHFGVQAPDATTYLDRYYQFSHPRSLRSRLSAGAPFARLHYLATSEVLAREVEEILEAPAFVFHGLTDYRHFLEANGGEDATASVRRSVSQELGQGRVRLLARVADLTAEMARSVSRCAHLVQHRGFSVDLRILFHTGNIGRLREVAAAIDFPFANFHDTTQNDDYIRQLNQATLVVLPYDVQKYEKRVSAVLHDCSVMGIPVVVPAGSTLADSAAFAATFVYSSSANMLGTTLNAIRSLQRDFCQPERVVPRAHELFASDVIRRLIDASKRPSLIVAKRGPIANVLQPLWGRCGSSYAMEAQVRFLLDQGYFVNQIFMADRPATKRETIPYFWKILSENSYHTRGSLQRIAFVDEGRAKRVRRRRGYKEADALTQYMMRIAEARTEDAKFDRLAKRAEITIVNHVFNTLWAKRRAGGKQVLETHDIQSYQLVNWPLQNDTTLLAETIDVLLRREMDTIKAFDFVVNVAPDEHRILSLANSRSKLVTPYLPETKAVARYRTVAEMGAALGWHPSYRDVDRFDLVIAGDSHLANRESTKWFIDDVFLQYLAPRRVSLAICGRLSEVLYRERGTVGGVYYVGFVEDLVSVLALSKLAILPDRRGTGISIKTLEVFAMGLPFIGTSTAFRGIRGQLPPEVESYDAPDAMARAIVSSLSHPDALEELADLARRCHVQVSGKARFVEDWNEILSLVVGGSRAAQHRQQEGATENATDTPIG